MLSGGLDNEYIYVGELNFLVMLYDTFGEMICGDKISGDI